MKTAHRPLILSAILVLISLLVFDCDDGDPSVGPKFIEADIIIKFIIDNPAGEIWLTPNNNGEVICGSASLAPTIEMALSGDTCHKFWLQEVSMPVALAKGLIKAKGPLPKALKLLPLLKPAYEA